MLEIFYFNYYFMEAGNHVVIMNIALGYSTLLYLQNPLEASHASYPADVNNSLFHADLRTVFAVRFQVKN